MLALASALCSAVSTMLIQRGLRHANFYAGFWINIVVGMIGLWSVVLLMVPPDAYHWSAVPYFVLSGVVGTAAGRLFRVVAIEKVGAPVAASINNLSPFIATGLAILLLGERVTLPILLGTLVLVLGTILLSQSGRHMGFRVCHLLYPLLAASWGLCSSCWVSSCSPALTVCSQEDDAEGALQGRCYGNADVAPPLP